jgi:hypothetical protein
MVSFGGGAVRFCSSLVAGGVARHAVPTEDQTDDPVIIPQSNPCVLNTAGAYLHWVEIENVELIVSGLMLTPRKCQRKILGTIQLRD